MKEILLTGILVGLSAIVGLASRFIFKKKPDNYIEEMAEKIIHKKTGIDIDLSPDHPDTNTTNVIDVTHTLKKKEDTDQTKKKD